MGEVYAATDSRLGRNVAVKVLPADVSADPERRARFEREARTVGALSHPNIVAIHDVGVEGPLTYLVMELLVGETLRARLNQVNRSGLPSQKSLDIAAQVALGLAAAHARGIVHRDLKPENIFLTTDGRVKVLDFGLARAVAITSDATRTTPLDAIATAPGMVMGTVGYMAPEQVRGREADHRADIFALGAVLYEMLTGTRAFAADSSVETLSAILNSDPLERRDVLTGLPAPVEGAVRHCLEKHPDERFQSARDLAFQLHALAGGSAGTGPTAAVLPRARARWHPALTAIVAAALVGAAAFVAGRQTVDPPEIVDVGLPEEAPIALVDATPWAGEQPAIAVASTGDFFVYVARREDDTELWYRSLTTNEARALPGTAGGISPFLSPDGRRAGFFTQGELKQVPVDGSSPATAIGSVSESYGGVWLDEKRILIAPNFGYRLELVDVPSGRTSAISGISCRRPAAVVDGAEVTVVCAARDMPDHISHLLHFQGTDQAGDPSELQTVAGDQRGLPGSNPTLRGNTLIWVTHEGELAAATLDLGSGKVGPPEVVERQLRRSRIWSTANYGVTDTGDLVFVPGTNAGLGRFVVAARGAGARALPVEPKQFLKFAVSFDGTRLAATSLGAGANVELWLYEVSTGRGERVARGLNISVPVFRPDGKVVFGLTQKTGQIDRLVANPDKGNAIEALAELPFVPDRFVTAETIVGTPAGDIAVGQLGPKPATLRTLVLPDNQFYPVVSPDGQWVAYSGIVQGTTDAYVAPFPGLDYQLKVSANGGSEPVFLPDGSLVFRKGTRWYRAARTASGRPFAAAELYWSDDALMNTSGLSNAVMPDGSLLYLRSVAPSTAGYVRVVRGWLKKATAAIR